MKHVTRQRASVFGFTAHDAAEPSHAGGLNCQHREVTSEICSRAATPDFRGNVEQQLTNWIFMNFTASATTKSLRQAQLWLILAMLIIMDDLEGGCCLAGCTIFLISHC